MQDIVYSAHQSKSVFKIQDFPSQDVVFKFLRIASAENRFRRESSNEDTDKEISEK